MYIYTRVHFSFHATWLLLLLYLPDTVVSSTVMVGTTRRMAATLARFLHVAGDGMRHVSVRRKEWHSAFKWSIVLAALVVNEAVDIDEAGMADSNAE
jgi:hypothetical protein